MQRFWQQWHAAAAEEAAAAAAAIVAAVTAARVLSRCANAHNCLETTLER